MSAHSANKAWGAGLISFSVDVIVFSESASCSELYHRDENTPLLTASDTAERIRGKSVNREPMGLGPQSNIGSYLLVQQRELL